MRLIQSIRESVFLLGEVHRTLSTHPHKDHDIDLFDDMLLEVEVQISLWVSPAHSCLLVESMCASSTVINDWQSAMNCCFESPLLRESSQITSFQHSTVSSLGSVMANHIHEYRMVAVL